MRVKSQLSSIYYYWCVFALFMTFAVDWALKANYLSTIMVMLCIIYYMIIILPDPGMSKTCHQQLGLTRNGSKYE